MGPVVQEVRTILGSQIESSLVSVNRSYHFLYLETLHLLVPIFESGRFYHFLYLETLHLRAPIFAPMTSKLSNPVLRLPVYNYASSHILVPVLVFPSLDQSEGS